MWAHIPRLISSLYLRMVSETPMNLIKWAYIILCTFWTYLCPLSTLAGSCSNVGRRLRLRFWPSADFVLKRSFLRFPVILGEMLWAAPGTGIGWLGNNLKKRKKPLIQLGNRPLKLIHSVFAEPFHLLFYKSLKILIFPDENQQVSNYDLCGC